MDEKRLVGRRIKELRARRGYSQEALAERMGISGKYLGSVERGNENPTLEFLVNCAHALRVDLVELFNFSWLGLRERDIREKLKHIADNTDVERLVEMLAVMRAREL